MLSFDKDTVWGVRRGGDKNNKSYTLFAEPNKPMADGKTADFRNPKDTPSRGEWTWNHGLTLRPHAMLKAADKIVLAGMPTFNGENIDAFEGRGGGILAVRAAEDGSELSQIELDAPPVWDGMAADDGLLIISCKDGCVRGMK